MKNLELDFIAAKLEGLEETIILKLIDRCQFKSNQIVYENGKSGFQGELKKSLLEIRLYHEEYMDALFGRYRQPEERPFTQKLPDSKRIVSIPDSGLFIRDLEIINLTENILSSYKKLVPQICKEGDDGQYGSSVVADVYALQAIAERIHYGSLYVAECKYRDNPTLYSKLIKEKNKQKAIETLTRKEVEERIISRIRDKVSYVQANVNLSVRNIIPPEIIITYYRDYIIPLTKEGEIRYLFNRENVF
jgi:chorismate mutase